MTPAADAPAELVKLRNAKILGFANQHERCVGNIDAHLDHGRGNQHVTVAARKLPHDAFYVGIG